MLMAVLAMMTSCLKGSDRTTVTLYSDAAINYFVLGSLNRYVHTVSSTGEDSVYKVEITGSDYDFHIDQVNRRIYNTDSLPVGTDVKHVVCTISSVNNGTVTIKDIDSDTLRYFSSADSIDFSQPRTFHIFSSDGEGESIYTISVNVHQQEGTEFNWEQVGFDYEPAAKEETELPEGIKMLIGEGAYEKYALSDNNLLMVSRDGGQSWQEDQIAGDAAMLPVRDLALASYPMTLADSTDYVVLVGNRSVDDYPDEQIAMVWRKIVDYGSHAPQGRWVYMERTDNNRQALPRMEGMAIVRYDGSILAFGGAGLGGVTRTPWSTVYQSRDNGINWRTTTAYPMPEGFDAAATRVEAEVDDQQFVWLRCSGTGQVWRGRLNRLGWTK